MGSVENHRNRYIKMNSQNHVKIEQENLLDLLKMARQLGETNTTLSAKQLVEEIVRQIKNVSKK